MNKIYRYIFTFIFLLVLPSVGWASPSCEGNVCTAESCNNTTVGTALHVQAAIDATTMGGTVIVPAGSCTWDTPLQIIHRITLYGAGKGVTNITTDFTPADDHAVHYTPSVKESAGAFEMYGFTFDLETVACALKILNTDVNTPIKIRTHDNEFLNVKVGNSVDAGIAFHGSIYGVVYDNTLTGYPHIDIYGVPAGGGKTSWENLTWVGGQESTLFIEDNDFTFNTGAAAWASSTCGHGGRSVWRHNTFTTGGSGSISPWFDAHGNQSGTNFACMGAEYYNNKLVVSTSFNNHNAATLGDIRGGRSFIYNNVITHDSFTTHGIYTLTFVLREEWADVTNNETGFACPDAGGVSTGGNTCAQDDINGVRETLHVNASYSWNNWGEDHQGVEGALELTPITKSLDICTGQGTSASQNRLVSANACYNALQIMTGTATGGTTTTLIDTATNFVTAGVSTGDWVVNTTKATAQLRGAGEIISITTTTNANDTLTFAEMNITNANTDAYYIVPPTAGIQPNIDWWTQPATGMVGWDGTSGVGCGTAAAKDAIETCTNGVGFWVPDAAVDPTAASCGDLSTYAGAGATELPGKLYRCSSNTWVEYYTPYTYPHPLRASSSSGSMHLEPGKGHGTIEPGKGRMSIPYWDDSFLNRLMEMPSPSRMDN